MREHGSEARVASPRLVVDPRGHGRQPDSDAALHGLADERRQALDHLIAVAE
jgi:hypothetical protein